MREQREHEEALKNLAAQLKPLLEKSEQAVYIYLDDMHRVCNANLASLLGYSSPAAWAASDSPLDDFAGESQKAVIASYEAARRRMMASSLEVAVKHRDTDRFIRARLIVVPFTSGNQFFALYFLSEL